MAGDPLNAPSAVASDPAGPIAAYLTALDAALSGSRRARADVLDEVHDGLLAATDRHRYRGATALEAEQAALAEVGRPELVARAFAGELATAGHGACWSRCCSPALWSECGGCCCSPPTGGRHIPASWCRRCQCSPSSD